MMQDILSMEYIMISIFFLLACESKSTDTTAAEPSTEDTQTEDTTTSEPSSDDTSSSEPSTEDTATSEEIDITDIVLDSRSGNCVEYVQSSISNVLDVKRDMAFSGSFVVTLASDKCLFSSNAIPNHDFNDGNAQFATGVSEKSISYEMVQSPTQETEATGLNLMYDNAIFLNGVKLDLLAAACYGVGPDPLGQEKIGCSDASTPWRYDPMFAGNNFGTDGHNAHTQPDGTYHYHGDPMALYDDGGSVESPVIGFAADGFPIFGPYIDDNGSARKVVSGYTLKSGERVSMSGEGAFPGGDYDGTFRDDYQYTGAGDLDECNGMERDGVYGYYITDSYPWVLACFKGSPDSSFQKGMPE